MPPQLLNNFPFSVHITWDPVRFCGVDPPSILDSISYSIELAEGVEWKDGKLSQYMNDIMIPNHSYKSIFKSSANTYLNSNSNEYDFNFDLNVFNLTIKELKPATWYHIRLVIEYLGLKVTSDALNIHTTRAAPSTPALPRLSVFPVRSSFDLLTETPSRLESLITWNSCYYTNGSPVSSYQVHMRRLDSLGNILNDEPPLLHKINMDAQQGNPQRSIAALLNTHQANNQWIQSPSKSEQQIRNSLRSRLQSRESEKKGMTPTREKTPQKLRKSQSSSFSPSLQQLQPLSHSPQPLHPQQIQVHQSPSSGHPWRIIYDNLHRSLRVGAPRPTDATWQIRVRARNSEGWSDFSPVLEVNNRTHPTLFATNTALTSTMKKSSRPRQRGISRDQDSPEDGEDFNIDTSNSQGSTAGYMTMNSPLMMQQSFLGQQQFFQSQQAPQQQMFLQEMVMFPIAGHAADIERPVSRMPKQFGDLDAAADGAVGRRPLVLPQLVHHESGGQTQLLGTSGSGNNQSQRGSSKSRR